MDNLLEISSEQRVKLIFPCGKTEIKAVSEMKDLDFEFKEYELV